MVGGDCSSTDTYTVRVCFSGICSNAACVLADAVWSLCVPASNAVNLILLLLLLLLLDVPPSVLLQAFSCACVVPTTTCWNTGTPMDRIN